MDSPVGGLGAGDQRRDYQGSPLYQEVPPTVLSDSRKQLPNLEWEVSSLRQELDGTRAALRLQASRCRHLVAAFSTQLQRQESAARRERELRDVQLSRLLRALLVLDAGLRREQRNIREQLHSKDALIHAQQLELAMLRGDHDVTLHVLPLKANGEVTSRTHEGANDEHRVVNSVVETNGDSTNSQLQSSKSTAYARFRKHSQKTISQHNKLKAKSTNVVEEHPVLHRAETRGLEQLQKMASELKDEMVEISEDSYHDPDEELPNRNLYEDYQHNPVLECVNQILLSDLEESEEREVRADKESYLHASEPEVRPVQGDARSKMDRHVDKEESKLKSEGRKWPNNKDKTPSPPAKEHLEEKACLMMSSQRLTLVRHVDFEEVDKKEDDAVNASAKRGAPPALPPKPSQLQLGSRAKKPSLVPQNPQKLPNPCKPVEKTDKPHQRKILSNGSLKYPLNLEHTLQENRQNNHNTNCNGKSFEDKIDEMNITILHHNTPRGMAVMNGHVTKSRDEKKSGKIRVGSSVSSLITGASGDSIVNELAQGNNVPKVSNMVRRFEDLGTCIEEDEGEEEEKGNDTLRENFEEFKLEDVDMDAVEQQGRPEGDGAETKINGGTYEHFLESTGLSQKSIMTPSRMLSNHRSVLKPKDIKHRSRLLKAAAFTNHGGSIVKYWTEPFL